MSVRVVFMGTPEFAVPCLEKLLAMPSVEVVGVVTQPDKQRGRGHRLTPSPVKLCAEQHGLAALQPARVKSPEAIAALRALAPDLVVVVAYGQILSAELLALPPLGCVNVHASLLPRYRGAAPMQWSLINGEPRTGVTTMMMDVGLDTGDMLLRRELDVPPAMTFGELHDAMMPLAAEALGDTIDALLAGTLTRQPQTGLPSTYAPMITRDTAHLDWHRSAVDIRNLVRAMNPAPGAWSTLRGQTFKLLAVRPLAARTAAEPGTILSSAPLTVATGDGAALEVVELQAPGKRRMAAADYLRGNPPLEGIFNDDT